MKKLERDSVVVIDNQEIKINEVLPLLVLLPADSILNYFTALGLMFPRNLRMNVLRDVIRPYVNNERHHANPLSDELIYRLRWYDTFSEYQYVNLLPIFEDGTLLAEYKENLWLSVLCYMLEKQVSYENFDRLLRLTKALENVPTLEHLDGKAFNNVIDPLFFDEEDTIDGLTLGIFRPVVYKCSTLGEVREIGTKYGVDVPRRLRKKELLEIIIDELKDRNELTPEVEEKLKGMTVIPLQRFAINNEIKVSIELKKEEIIEYILKNAHQTKAKYFKPQADSYLVYDQADYEIPEVEPVIVEQPVKEEPVKVILTLVVDDLETNLEVIKGEKIETPKVQPKEDHEFKGWHLGEELYDFNLPIEENITLHALFTEIPKEMVKVTFTGLEEDLVVELEKGKTVIEPEKPAKKGHSFVGWHLGEELYEFNNSVEEDLTLVAMFVKDRPTTATVTFIAKGEKALVEVKLGEVVNRPVDPEKEGFEFIGWFLNDNLYDFEHPVKEDLELIAQWYELEPETVTITFIDEETAHEVKVVKGEKVELLEVAPKEGYTFKGWYLGEELYDFNLEVVEDIILIAIWEEKQEKPTVVKEEAERVYVSTNFDNEDISKALEEMRKISKLVEELKYAVNLINNPNLDKLDEEIDFSDKNGFEGTKETVVSIKEPVILSPYKLKVSKKSFNKLIKKKYEKETKIRKVKRNVVPVPVVVIDENEEDAE